jgi:murein DD-endopeptidase MepM/ murein hydrolase activator NlpD
VIPRRAFLIDTMALVLAPGCIAWPSPSAGRLSLSGSLQQGSLVIGRVQPHAHVLVNDGPVLLSDTGLFAFGLDYDQKKPTAVAVQCADGTSETRSVRPVARTYEVQKINGLPEKFVSPPSDIQKRIDDENARIAKARKVDSSGTAFAETFDWPTTGIISSLFGSQRILNGIPKAPHFGVDIAAPEGTPIHAPADATVSLAEPDFYLTGGTTVLDHGHGVFTMYIHQNTLKVSAGQTVKRGGLIGLVGMKGRATGPHLHWGMNWFQMKVDPSLSTRTPSPAKA